MCITTQYLWRAMFSTKRGLTLIELMVALFILSLIISAIFAVYISNLQIYKSEVKTAETQMEKIVTLEVVRRDVVHAGYGLPWNPDPQPAYTEAASVPASNYNDAPTGVPRAFVMGNNAVDGISDYLVMKSALATFNDTTGKWGLSNGGSSWDPEAMGEGGDFGSSDYVIIVEAVGRDLYMDGDDNWCFQGDALGAETPADEDTVYLIYGVRNGGVPRMPFNRVDYYLSTANLPTQCNPNTYVLNRATINHADGTRTVAPVLSCVRDFQVAFGLDADGDGIIDAGGWSSTLPTDASGVRRQVKEVRVFVLYQEGQRFNTKRTDADSINLGDADTGTLSTVALSTEDKDYRWKILKVAVRPLNMEE